MDNTLKLLLGVLGISGLIAMLVPSSTVVPAPEVAVEAPAPATPVVTETPPEPQVSEGSTSEVYDFSSFGNPMNNAEPVDGFPSDNSSSPSSNNDEADDAPVPSPPSSNANNHPQLAATSGSQATPVSQQPAAVPPNIEDAKIVR